MPLRSILAPYTSRHCPPGERVARVFISAAVIALLVASWPGATSPLEWGKLWIASVLLVGAVIAWAVTTIRHGWRRVPLGAADIMVGVIVVIWALASLSSTQRWTSIFGLPGTAHHALSAILLFAVLWYLVQWTYPRRRDKRPLLTALFVGLGIGTVWTAVNVIRALLRASDTAVRVDNPFVASNDLLAMIIAAFVVITFHAWRRSHRRAYGIATAILGAVGLFCLIILDRFEGWFVLGLGLIGMLVWELFTQRRFRQQTLILPLLTVLLAAAGMLFPFTFGRVMFVSDLALDAQTSWSIAGEALIERPLFGTGPETFAYDFTRLKPVSYNATSLWQLRFVRAHDEFTHLLPTVGGVGTLALLGGLLWLIVGRIISLIRARRWRADRTHAEIILMVLLPVVLTAVWRTWSVALMTIIVCTALIAVERREPTWKHHYRMRIGLRAFLAIALVLVIAGGETAIIRQWVGDSALERADAFRSNDPVAAEDAARFSLRVAPGDARMHSLLGSIQIQEVFVAVNAGTDVASVQSLVDEGILHLRDGAAQNPQDVTALEKLIAAYQGIASISDGTENVLPDLFGRAILLDPANPSLIAEAGRYHLSVALTKESDDDAHQWNAAALALFEQARALKSDDLDAILGVAVAEERLGDTDAADTAYADLTEQGATSADALLLVADWYERQGRNDEAVGEYNAVLALDPENEQAQSRLDALTTE